MRKRISVLIGGVAVAALSGPALAGGWADSPLGKASFGEVWNGRPFNPADLAGRVVLVKTWADG